MAKRPTIHLTLHPEIVAAGRVEAARRQTSLSGLVEILIRELKAPKEGK